MEKNGYDSEYPTNDLSERNFLTDNGVRYTFVKTNEFGIRTFKYEKTSKLFELLAKYYK